MNHIHIHLMLSHVPVLGTIFGAGLLLFAFWRKSDVLKKTSLGVFAVAALLAIPVYLTGESAEHEVERLPGVLHSIVEEHEEAAEVAFIGVLVLGAVALAGLIWRWGKEVPGWFAAVVLAGSIAVGGLMTWTANLGGQVRHTEIRPDTVSPAGEAETDRH